MHGVGAGVGGTGVGVGVGGGGGVGVILQLGHGDGQTMLIQLLVPVIEGSIVSVAVMAELQGILSGLSRVALAANVAVKVPVPLVSMLSGGNV